MKSSLPVEGEVQIIVMVWVMGQKACQENVVKRSCDYHVKCDPLECCDWPQYAQPLDESYNEPLEKIALTVNASISHWLHTVT